MAAQNAQPLLRFIHQTTCIQRHQEMRKNVRHAELSKWSMLVRNVGQLIPYIGVVEENILTGMLRSS
jgi:hypothetical protein